MKSGLAFASLIILTPLMLPYGFLVPKSWGNPNWDSYVGQSGSTYDAAANPPQTIGGVTYNPNAALPPVSPSAPSGSGGAAMTPAR